MTTEVSHTTTGKAPPQVAEKPLGRRFGVHLTSVALANLADGMVMTGAPLIAVTLTQSPTEIAMLQVVFWLPWLLFGIVAGLIVDRTDRRSLRMAAMVVRALILTGTAAAGFTDRLTMPMLIGGVALYGLTQVFVDLAGRAMVPQVAPRSRLAAANGRVLAAEKITNMFLGGPLAGALLVLGSGWVLGVPAAMCVAFVLLLAVGLRGSYRVERTEPRAPLKDVAEGVRFLAGHPVLRPMLVAGSVLNMANTAYFAVFVLWVVGEGSVVGLDAEAYPLLLAVLAVGAVLGSLSTERIQRRVDEVPMTFTAWGINSSMLLVPVLFPSAWAIGAALFVLGFTNTISNVVNLTIRQRLVATGMLGRVGGASSTIGYGLMPIGALLGGLAGEAWGLPTVFLGATAMCFLGLLYPVLRVNQDLVRRHELPGDPEPA